MRLTVAHSLNPTQFGGLSINGIALQLLVRYGPLGMTKENFGGLLIDYS